MNKVVPVWKKGGQSTHKIAQEVAKLYGEKTAHTGILDPMAEGVITILVGDSRFEKEKYTNTKKTYIADILVGVSTDTHDLLGMVNKVTDSKKLCREKIEKVLPQFVGEINQKPPDYSAIVVNGRRLFAYARKKQISQVDIPSFRRVVYEIGYLGRCTIEKDNLMVSTRKNISKVVGDFRQDEILTRWGAVYPKLSSKMHLFSLKIKTGRGTYIRSIVRDLSELLAIPLTTLKLVRTKNGEYTKDDCVFIKY